MLSRIAYVLRETGASLRRNLTLTAAALVTVVVTLALLGFSLLIQRSVSNLLVQWKSGVQVIVFMNPEATAEQVDAVQRELNDNPLVKPNGVDFVDKTRAAEEFKRLYPNEPELTSISADQLPVSFRIVPRSNDDQTIDTLSAQLQKKTGVLSVQSAKEVVAFFRTLSNYFRWGTFFGAVFLGGAAVMLIWNTIRTAMFARRREIEVMKLVGATNWFIRWPFVLEGIIQGLIGAVLACLLLGTGNRFWNGKVVGAKTLGGLQSLRASNAQFTSTCVVILVLGVLIGAVASAVAATRFLDV